MILVYHFFFLHSFFNDTATTEIYTLSLHDALPICEGVAEEILNSLSNIKNLQVAGRSSSFHFKSQDMDLRQIGQKLGVGRSEEHTSELQSQSNLVCRLLLEKKKTKQSNTTHTTRPE